MHAPRQKLRVVREVGVSADRSQLSHARRYAEQAAAAFGLDPRRSYEFVYAVNEAVTNAIRHGAPDAEGMIRMSVHSDENLLTLTVRDCGTFAAGLPARAARGEHGRGLALMARFTDELSLTISHGATVVSLSKARA